MQQKQKAYRKETQQGIGKVRLSKTSAAKIVETHIGVIP